MGRLTVVSRGPNDGNSPRWHCRCDCGSERLIYGGHLRRANQQSCGCARREKNTKHGLSNRHSAYQAWVAMMGRCYNSQSKAYANYGGRGIRVCDRWHDPVQFCSDMGPRPSAEHSIDRIDNDGNYEPENCRWATKKQQMNNRRVSRKITHNGQTRTVAKWAADLGIGWHIIAQRISRGWTTKEAIETPVRKKRDICLQSLP